MARMKIITRLLNLLKGLLALSLEDEGTSKRLFKFIIKQVILLFLSLGRSISHIFPLAIKEV